MRTAEGLGVATMRHWLAVGVVWLGLIAGITAWLIGTPAAMLREQLRQWQFWSLESCVFLGVACGALLVRELAPQFDRVDRRLMAGLAALAVGLTLLVAPRTNRLFYDEQIYQATGQNLSDLRLAQVCNDGNIEYGRLECSSGEYNKQPYAYPHALSLAYRLVGVHGWVAFAVNALAMAGSVCGVYVLVCLLFERRDAALLGALLMALLPEQVIWSATAAVEPTASCAIVAALVAAAAYSRSGSTAALASLAVALAYAIQFRPESLLIVPVVGMIAWPRLAGEMDRPRFWWAGIAALALSAVHIAHLYSVRNAGWGSTGARFALAYVADNFRVNGPFYIADERFPPVVTLLALAGLAATTFVRERLALTLYFLSFFGIGLLFYAGSYDYGADVRYSLMTFPPLATLGGMGAVRLLDWVQPHWRRTAQAVLIAALLYQSLWYAPVVRATTNEAWAARADVKFAGSVASTLPPDAYVLTHNPGMFHVWGVNAGQMSLVVGAPKYLDVLSAKYAGGIYLHWNFWCNVQDGVQAALCRDAMTLAPFELVREQRERDQVFAFYRLQWPPP
jgi:Dolichyl-phosphate-mannose-protein mannosyltransferase